MNTLIKTESPEKSYGTFTLGHIDFTLEPGCVLGLVGPNGAGKTALIKCLLGLVIPNAGTFRSLDESSPSRDRC